MTPDRVAAALGSSVKVTTPYDELVADVALDAWRPAALTARDDLGLTFFDLLTAVDVRADGFEVVVRVWSVADRTGLQLRTRCAAQHAVIASLHDVYAGARWHERQVAELFGITFTGHPGLDPLLLAPDAGHPLRKDSVLAARVATPWPGAKEPGESDRDLTGRSRRKNLPLGVTVRDLEQR
ncbi:MAG: NADH-quinone oxidoreductase subunit C [Mycobacteriales bacterium]